jgi:hypothetical protein
MFCHLFTSILLIDNQLAYNFKKCPEARGGGSPPSNLLFLLYDYLSEGVFIYLESQRKDIESIHLLVNKKAWFHTVKRSYLVTFLFHYLKSPFNSERALLRDRACWDISSCLNTWLPTLPIWREMQACKRSTNVSSVNILK